jgi:hypothetical protein
MLLCVVPATYVIYANYGRSLSNDKLCFKLL